MTNEQRPLIPVNPYGLEDIAAGLLNPQINISNTSDTAPKDLPDIVKRNPKNYILIPEKNVVIATRQEYNGLTWEDAIKITFKDRLKLPRIDEFMQHFLNLKEAANGRKGLVYADGSPVTTEQAMVNWNYVSSRDRSPYSNQAFWTWMDAKFKETPKGLELHTDHKVDSRNAIRPNSGTVVVNDYLGSNDFADIPPFNAQGLPKVKSTDSQYVQGKNIYFWRPVKDRVAWFYADSGGAGLSCGGDPASVDSHLGVLACAAGAAPKNKEQI